MACVYALFCTMVIYKEYKWRDLPKLVHRVTKTVAMVMMVIGFAAGFGYLMAIMQLPAKATQLLPRRSPDDKYVMLLLINILLLLLGTFMDMAPMILICTPIMLPVVKAMGVDPVHFGMIMLLNLGIGLITPPVGPTLFVGCAIGKVTMEEVSRELWPFYGAMCVALLIVTYVPGAFALAAAPAGALAARRRANSLNQATLSAFAMASSLNTSPAGVPSRSFLTGSSIFLPERVRGIEPTWKISLGTWRAEQRDLDAFLQASRQRIVEHQALAQNDEERHVALASEVLEIDDQAVDHFRHGFDRAVELGRSHADAVAIDGGVAAPVDDGAAARRDPDPVAMAPDARIDVEVAVAIARGRRFVAPEEERHRRHRLDADQLADLVDERAAAAARVGLASRTRPRRPGSGIASRRRSTGSVGIPATKAPAKSVPPEIGGEPDRRAVDRRHVLAHPA